MHNNQIQYAADLALFYQATQIPLCVFDNTPTDLLRHPLIENMTCSPITLAQCCKALENTSAFVPQLFASDCFYFALIRLDEKNNIMLGPVSSITLTYREFYESNKNDCDPSDLTHLYRVIQQSPHVSLTQFAADISLFIKLISRTSLSIQDILAAQSELPKQYDTLSTPGFSEPHYTFVNEAMAFEKTILYHIRGGNMQEIENLFSKPTFFNNADFIPASVEECYKIFFVYATLCCITAIEEGLDMKKAFPLFDAYISKIPTISSPSELSGLCRSISLEYCQQVQRLHEYQSDSTVITKCLQYIHENIQSKITIDHLATHCNLSKRSITRHFTMHFHTSVSDYILTQKLKEAAFLLSNSDFSLAEISHQLAFSSQSHFTVAFKKKYLYTPQQYREKFQSIKQ